MISGNLLKPSLSSLNKTRRGKLVQFFHAQSKSSEATKFALGGNDHFSFRSSYCSYYDFVRTLRASK